MIFLKLILGLFFLIFFEITFWIPSGPIYVCLNLSWSLQDVCILIFALWIAFNMKKKKDIWNQGNEVEMIYTQSFEMQNSFISKIS